MGLGQTRTGVGRSRRCSSRGRAQRAPSMKGPTASSHCCGDRRLFRGSSFPRWIRQRWLTVPHPSIRTHDPENLFAMDRVQHGVRPVSARIYEAISLELVRARRTKGRGGVTETGRLSESFGCLIPREGDALRIGRRRQRGVSGDVIQGQGHAALRGEAISWLAEDTRATLAKGGCRHAREAFTVGACPHEEEKRTGVTSRVLRATAFVSARPLGATVPRVRGHADSRDPQRVRTSTRVRITQPLLSRGAWNCVAGRTPRRS